jgi:(E)-4-hydroxy-3-methylbut-2-enyl-diphosphate synthase
MAARIVEKVRINPGNYADKKKFASIEYTDDDYDAELERIRNKFVPLVNICKEYGTAMRIGTNHGSLSDRIMSRYGDTPLGMVESALEFLRICEDLNYLDIVISMKSSNPQVMVQAYRLLVEKLDEEKLQPYPLHLGVTEAGEAEDGRIKSALGIGTLLEDGLGDTVRVSLTEEPEAEIPVAKLLVEKAIKTKKESFADLDHNPIDPFHYTRRKSLIVNNIGGSNVPRIIADFSLSPLVEMSDLKPVGHFYLSELDKWKMNDLGCDYIYSGTTPATFMLPNGLQEIVDYEAWKNLENTLNIYPLITVNKLDNEIEIHNQLNFAKIECTQLNTTLISKLSSFNNFVIILESHAVNAMQDFRQCMISIINAGIHNPVIFKRKYQYLEEDEFRIHSTTDMGSLFIDGLGDGIQAVFGNDSTKLKLTNETAFGILQAARTRITKTEYISCPSCGRTLFDLQETTAKIRERTDHLKGLKIGIMGCIVNGPGEMADADYGYVGSGKGKITLYKGQEVVKRNVPVENALDELIDLIKHNGEWIDLK